MWKATIGVKPTVPPKPTADEDDWDTPNFVNDVTEKESRWGAKTVSGSGHQESVRLDELRDEVLKSDQALKEQRLAHMSKPSSGYGGTFGVQAQMDKSAVGYDYDGKVEAHQSAKDYKKGFGGQYGTDDRQDKSAVGWNYKSDSQKHESQTDYKKGFGGVHGKQTDRQDKSAVGWEHREDLSKHASQTDYKKGFNKPEGPQDKSAVGWDYRSETTKHESQTDYKKGYTKPEGPQDKSAVGWDYDGKVEAHQSAKDYKKGFGGQFGVEDRQDKSAVGWEERSQPAKHESQTDYKKGYTKPDGPQDKSAVGWEAREDLSKHESQTPAKPEVPRARASDLRNKFEQMATANNQDDRVREERERRKREDEELKRRNEEAEIQRQQRIEAQHAKMPEVDDTPHMEPEHVESPSRSKPKSMGVRLPFAVEPQAVEPSSPPASPPTLPTEHISELHSQSSLNETVPAEPQHRVVKVEVEHVRIQVLPQLPTPAAATPSFAGNMPHRRQSSTDDEAKVEEEWADETPEPAIFNTPIEEPQSHFPEEPNEPTHSSNHQTSNQTYYDYVPEPPTQTQYDFVPDTPIQEPLASIPAYDEPPIPAAVEHNDNAGLTAIAVYDYQANDDDEISFDVGDRVTDIEQIDPGWWRGVSKGRYGLFPANYVNLQ
ncbi:hypothetical protein M3Y94_01086200 [Aphelenchoides besseyi]|nr:hypothetical protein M3Y94_01086200 [Aphelenchoides besseyi]